MAVKPSKTAASKDRSGRRAAFGYVVAAYFLANLIILPFHSFSAVYSGALIRNIHMVLSPFTQGAFFVIAIAINTESIFRVLQFSLTRGIMLVGPIGASMGQFTLLLCTFDRYRDMDMLSSAPLGAGFLCLEELVLTFLALVIGFRIHYMISREEFAAK